MNIIELGKEMLKRPYLKITHEDWERWYSSIADGMESENSDFGDASAEKLISDGWEIDMDEDRGIVIKKEDLVAALEKYTTADASSIGSIVEALGYEA